MGSHAEILAVGAPETAVVDMHGHLVLPGFEDSHMHFPGPSVNRPAYLAERDGHTGLANPKALANAGITPRRRAEGVRS